VRYVLEGSVRKAGNRLRITAQLIEAATGGHLWAEKYDGAVEDVFDLQDRITEGVVGAIEPSIRHAEIERAKRKRPDNLDAYDLYLRALEQAATFTQSGQHSALSLLDAAIALDPNYAEAHGLAAWCLQQRFLWGGRKQEDRDAALRHADAVAAARTDDAQTLAFAAFAKGALARDIETAFAMLDRALALNPSCAVAHNVSAVLNMVVSRPDRGRSHAEQSLRLSPFDPLRYLSENVVAVANLVAGQTEAALADSRRCLEANPAFSPGLVLLTLALVRLGRIEEARATMRRLLEIAPDTSLATLSERFLFIDILGVDRVVAELQAAGLPG
jgi:adenylate cyclase